MRLLPDRLQRAICSLYDRKLYLFSQKWRWFSGFCLAAAVAAGFASILLRAHLPQEEYWEIRKLVFLALGLDLVVLWDGGARFHAQKVERDYRRQPDRYKIFVFCKFLLFLSGVSVFVIRGLSFLNCG